MTSPPPFSGPAQWTELAPKVWVGVVEPETVNVGLVAGRDAALLIDCGSSPAQGVALRAAAEEVAGVPLVGVVVTHWHHDHAFGLAAFADLDTIGHESVVARLRGGEAAVAAESLGLAVDDVVVPRRTLAVATAVELGDRRVEIVHLGAGHTDGDLLVVVPDADVVFAGDLIESAGPPQSGPDSVVTAWAGTLDGLVGLMTADTRAVPGHGEAVGREFVFEARGRAAMAAAEAAHPEGVPEGRSELPLL